MHDYLSGAPSFEVGEFLRDDGPDLCPTFSIMDPVADPDRVTVALDRFRLNELHGQLWRMALDGPNYSPVPIRAIEGTILLEADRLTVTPEYGRPAISMPMTFDDYQVMVSEVAETMIRMRIDARSR